MSVVLPELVPEALALDESRIWVATKEGLWIARRNGGEPSLISPNPGVTDIALAGDHVYWSSAQPHSGVYRSLRSGGPIEELSIDVTVALAATADSLLASSWAVSPTVVRAYDLDDGKSRTLVELRGQDWLRKLAVAGDDLYFMPLQTLGPGEVHRARVSTGEDTIIANNFEAMDFAVTSDALYWTEQNWMSGTGADDTSEIRAVPRDGSAEQILVALNGYAYGIAANERDLFVALHELNASEYTAHLLRISRDGEEACELASSDGLAWKILLDPLDVYWFTSMHSGVMHVPMY